MSAVLRLVFAVAMAATPTFALAQMTLRVEEREQYEDNSNVFAQQPGFILAGQSSTQRSDFYEASSGAIALNYAVSQQSLYADIQGTDYHYDYFNSLSHTEYELDAGLNWTTARIFNGSVEIRRQQSMLAFTDVFQSALTLETEQRETAKIGAQVSSQWRVDFSGYTRSLHAPLFGIPNLKLDETSGTLAVSETSKDLIKNAALTMGLSAGYTEGSFSGGNDTGEIITGGPVTGGINSLAPSYHQNDVDFVATYASGKSSLQGQAGYSHRLSATGINQISGDTGLLTYTNALTGKTSLYLSVARQIDSYIANAGSQLVNSAVITINWQATYKIDVIPSYTWTLANLPGQGPTPGSDREDHLQYASLAIRYQPTRWLLLQPYAHYQTRVSNLNGANFNSTVYGIMFTFRWQNKGELGALKEQL